MKSLLQNKHNKHNIKAGEVGVIKKAYRRISSIRRTLLGNTIVYHSDVVGASPVGAAPTTASFPTEHLVSIDCTKTTARRRERYLSFVIWCVLYKRFDGKWNKISSVVYQIGCQQAWKAIGSKWQEDESTSYRWFYAMICLCTQINEHLWTSMLLDWVFSLN